MPKSIIYLLGVFLLTGITSCVKCHSEEPIISVNFVNDDGERVYPNFTSVYSPGYPSVKDLRDIRIPLNLSSDSTLFVFKTNEQSDTIIITYNRELEHIRGYCLTLNNRDLSYSTLPVRCFDLNYYSNTCSPYEISLYY